jgi:hypothetical protein
MDSTEDETPMLGTESEMKEILGLYDAPAFARRGHDLEFALDRLNDRFRAARAPMLDMVRLRLKQWAGSTTGHSSSLAVFESTIEWLWPIAAAPEPVWTSQDAPIRKLRGIAHDMILSIERFNRRWEQFVSDTNFTPINRLIERYNRYYVLEKECSLGSARLASRYFVPHAYLNLETALERFPKIPVPLIKK